MTHYDCDIIARYAADCAKRLGLSDWDIDVRHTELANDASNEIALASATKTYGRRHAVIRIDPKFMDCTPAKQRLVVIHELIHLHTIPVKEVVDCLLANSEKLTRPDCNMVSAAMTAAEEHAVDAIANAIAEYFPLIEWRYASDAGVSAVRTAAGASLSSAPSGGTNVGVGASRGRGRAAVRGRTEGMSWNHRIVRRDYGNGNVSHAIMEVFYDADGKPDGFSRADVFTHSEYGDGGPLSSLSKQLMWFGEALHKPVLDAREMGWTPEQDAHEAIIGNYQERLKARSAG